MSAIADTTGLLDSLVRNVPGAIYRCALDESWTMQLIGDEIEQISGYAAGEFLGSACRTFTSIIHPDDRDDVDALQGLADRVAAMGGRLAVESPPGAGTVLRADVPLTGRRD